MYVCIFSRTVATVSNCTFTTCMMLIVMCDCLLNRDALQRLSAATAANSHTKLTSLDLSRNSIEDRGCIFFSVFMYAKVCRYICHCFLNYNVTQCLFIVVRMRQLRPVVVCE